MDETARAHNAMRAETQRYVEAVIAAHPELNFGPDLAGPPPKFDPYPLPREHDAPQSLREIGEEVAKRHGLRLIALRSNSRSKPVVEARHEAFYLSRQKTRHSYIEIGRFYGDRDHTTAMHGVKKHAKRNGLPMQEAAA